MQDVLGRLLDYNEEANLRMIRAFSHAPMRGEVHIALMSHILEAHDGWNQRLGGHSPMEGVWHDLPGDEWEPRNKANHDQTRMVIASTPLDTEIEYKTTRGIEHKNTVGDIVLHLVNHSTHHRGQLAALLRENEIAPPVTDYVVLLREGS